MCLCLMKTLEINMDTILVAAAAAVVVVIVVVVIVYPHE